MNPRYFDTGGPLPTVVYGDTDPAGASPLTAVQARARIVANWSEPPADSPAPSIKQVLAGYGL